MLKDHKTIYITGLHKKQLTIGCISYHLRISQCGLILIELFSLSEIQLVSFYLLSRTQYVPFSIQNLLQLPYYDYWITKHIVC